MKSIKWLIGVIISISVFIILLITSVDWAVCHNEKYFESEFRKYNVSSNTKADMTSLMYVADEMMDYLLGERDDLILPVTIRGEVTEFFSEQAKQHMVDVKKLFLMGINIRRICIILTMAGILILMATKQDWAKVISKSFNIVSIVMVVISGALCTLIVMDFSHAFTVFHKIFFQNNLWMLEEDDTLINMVPEGFFVDTSIRIGLIFLGLFVVCISLSILYNSTFVYTKYKMKPSEMFKLIKGYKAEKEQFLVSIENGTVDWEEFSREEEAKVDAYAELKEGADFAERYAKAGGFVDEELSTQEVARESSKDITDKETDSQSKMQEQGQDDAKGAEQEVAEKTEEPENLQETEKKKEDLEEEQEITEKIEEKWGNEPDNAEEIVEKQENESEVKDNLDVEPDVEQDIEATSEEIGEPEALESEIEEPEVSESEIEEPEVSESEIEELEPQESEFQESISQEEEIMTPEQAWDEWNAEAKEEQQQEELHEIEEPEIINLDEPELEIIHEDEMEVVEDNRLAIKGIELEKARLEGEKLRRQYGIPYEEISPEEEKSLQERMQQLMDEYHVIQP